MNRHLADDQLQVPEFVPTNFGRRVRRQPKQQVYIVNFAEVSFAACCVGSICCSGHVAVGLGGVAVMRMV